jgi:hypothetical protein
VSGCGSPGGLRSEGPAPGAAAPALVWPERKVTPQNEFVIAEDSAWPLPSLPNVHQGDMRTVDPMAVLRADAESTPELELGDALHPDTVAAMIDECVDSGPDRKGCPIRPASYHDLTGDGLPELILGFDLAPDQCEVRAYTSKGGTVTRILATVGNPRTVEVADGELIIREPDWTRGYESSTIYKWDGEKMAYLAHMVQKAESSPAATTRSSSPSAVVP